MPFDCSTVHGERACDLICLFLLTNEDATNAAIFQQNLPNKIGTSQGEKVSIIWAICHSVGELSAPGYEYVVE